MSRQFTRDYLQDVSAGRIENARSISFAGKNEDLPAGEEKHLWGFRGLEYNDIVNTLGVQLYASSIDPSDNAYMVAFGIDTQTNGLLVQRFFQLNGQNKVPLDGLMFRVFTHYAIGSGSFNGDIYIYEDDITIGGVPQTPSKVKSFSTNRQPAFNGTFRVPNNSELFIYDTKEFRDTRKSFDVNIKTKELGMSEFVNDISPSSPRTNESFSRRLISAGTDIKLSAISRDNLGKLKLEVEGILEF